MRGPLAVLALAGVCAGALAACSGDGSGRPALQQALAHVRATDQTRQYVEFGRPRDVPSAAGWTAVRALGLGGLGPYATQVRGALGVSLLDARYAITAGQPPTSSTLATGLSLARVPADAARLGATRTSTGGATLFRFAADGRIVLTGPLQRALPGITTQANLLRVSGSELGYGPSAAAVATTSAGGSSSLLSDRTIGPAASCLGDPLAAELTERVTSAQAVATYGVQLVGVGVMSGRRPGETLCVVTDSAAHATALADAVRSALASGSSGVSRQRWSALVTDARVSVDGAVVRLRADDRGGVVGVLLRGMNQGDLPGLA